MSLATASPIVSDWEWNAHILAQVAAGTITQEDALLQLKLPSNPARNLSCKVSPKEALSVYGLQRRPVTLYAEQWERLLAFASSISEFIVNHDKQLTRKHRQG
jgi:hypothetical protein